MRSIADARLYTFIDTGYLAGRDPAEVARQLCDGGSDIIQLRAKNASPEEVLRLAEAILPVTHNAGVPLVINDHFDIACRIGAQFCHLGQEDFFDAGHSEVGQLFNPGVTLVKRPDIGLSTHAADQALRAIQAGPAYIAIGPVYATGTKPTARPVTLDYVRWAAQNVQIPWFAIGGINSETIEAVLEAGAKRVCVVSAILNAEDVAGECRKFRKLLV